MGWTNCNSLPELLLQVFYSVRAAALAEQQVATAVKVVVELSEKCAGGLLAALSLRRVDLAYLCESFFALRVEGALAKSLMH